MIKKVYEASRDNNGVLKNCVTCTYCKAVEVVDIRVGSQWARYKSECRGLRPTGTTVYIKYPQRTVCGDYEPKPEIKE
jgi:hypothetical protein